MIGDDQRLAGRLDVAAKLRAKQQTEDEANDDAGDRDHVLIKASGCRIIVTHRRDLHLFQSIQKLHHARRGFALSAESKLDIGARSGRPPRGDSSVAGSTRANSEGVSHGGFWIPRRSSSASMR